MTLIHTPGHTPGSQCFFVDGRLVAGDTLFLDGCGRTDFPGGDPGRALREPHAEARGRPRRRRSSTPVTCTRSAPSAPMGDVRRHNYVFRPRTLEQWMAMFGNDGF